jgi:hypothetical protein
MFEPFLTLPTLSNKYLEEIVFLLQSVPLIASAPVRQYKLSYPTAVVLADVISGMLCTAHREILENQSKIQEKLGSVGKKKWPLQRYNSH